MYYTITELLKSVLLSLSGSECGTRRKTSFGPAVTEVNYLLLLADVVGVIFWVQLSLLPTHSHLERPCYILTCRYGEYGVQNINTLHGSDEGKMNTRIARIGTRIAGVNKTLLNTALRHQ